MLDYSRKARSIVHGRKREDLDSDDILQLALTRLIEIVGEAAGRVSRPTMERHPEIPWRDIVSMRNRLIHGYDTVDHDLLWDTATVDLPLLMRNLERILDKP